MITIRTDGTLKEIQRALATAPGWMPKLAQRTLRHLGPIAVRRMQEAVEPNRYTGALADSITAEYSDGGLTATIGPTARRGGKHDAGLLLELGVPHAIPNAPWRPIKAWADFRGIPAFPVWWKIRTVGVDAHPFLDRTVALLDGEVSAAGERLADEAARAALYGG